MSFMGPMQTVSPTSRKESESVSIRTYMESYFLPCEVMSLRERRFSVMKNFISLSSNIMYMFLGFISFAVACFLLQYADYNVTKIAKTTYKVFFTVTTIIATMLLIIAFAAFSRMLLKFKFLFIMHIIVLYIYALVAFVGGVSALVLDRMWTNDYMYEIRKDFENYPKNFEVQAEWDSFQRKYKCCGLVQHPSNSSDNVGWMVWQTKFPQLFSSNKQVPESCCKPVAEDSKENSSCQANPTEENAFIKKDCWAEIMKAYPYEFMRVLGGTGLTYGLLMFAYSLVTCVRACQIRK